MGSPGAGEGELGIAPMGTEPSPPAAGSGMTCPRLGVLLEEMISVPPSLANLEISSLNLTQAVSDLSGVGCAISW